MKEICKYDLCTGCSACFNICPHNCITMTTDRNGELHPIVNQQRCIECGLCNKTCPVNTPPKIVQPEKCFAVWHSNHSFREKSASGGIAAALYLYFIQYLKGVVYGVTWNNELQPVFHRTESIDEIESFKGSKYVQAFIHTTYQQIKIDLKNNRYVLFIGTPCQIAGLKNFLKKDYPQLLTCDLVCHGVPPYEYFKSEIQRVSKRISKTITHCRFRGNDKFNYHFSLWNNQTLLLDKKGSRSYYLYGFLTSIILRESCYSCKYSTNQRIGDITLGDFIGLGKLHTTDIQPKNISVVTINTPKAFSIWTDLINKYPDIHFEPRPFEEAVTGGISFRQPATRNPKRTKFLSDYKTYGWNKAIRKALWKSILRNRIKQI